jgi:guanylate kinase
MSNHLVVVAGPSGVGKGTVVKDILSRYPNFTVSVSATTRAPRPGEVDGREYHFYAQTKFDELVANGQMLEHATVHGKSSYGTPKQPVLDALSNGKSVILEIDVQGAFQVKENYPDAVLIFIEPPSIEELEARLAGRGTETEAERQIRMQTAKTELAQADRFDFIVVNKNVSECADEVVKLCSR